MYKIKSIQFKITIKDKEIVTRMGIVDKTIRILNEKGFFEKSVKTLPWISTILTISSIVFFLSFGIKDNYRKTYISENALLPGQVISHFRESEWFYVRGIREEVIKMENSSVNKRNEILGRWFEEFGYQIDYLKEDENNKTLYSTFYGTKGDECETMVIAIPWKTSENKYNDGGIALGSGLARYFSKMTIWSKNLVFVFPENGGSELRKWVDAYYNTLKYTSGSIEVALILEYSQISDFFDHIELSYEGLNGQLPNLDLINTIVLVSEQEKIPCSIQNVFRNHIKDYTYFDKIKILAKGVLNMIMVGLVSSRSDPHAFSGRQTQAIVLKVCGGRDNFDITQFGRVVDLTLRSVNNLLEKFHQSFFFYFLVTPKHFISISHYIPIIGLLLLSYFLTIFILFFRRSNWLDTNHLNIKKTFSIIFLIQVFCLIIAYYSPEILNLIPSNLKNSLISTFSISLVLIPFIVNLFPSIPFLDLSILSLNDAYVLVAYAYFLIISAILLLAFVHFSLSLFIAIFFLPISLLLVFDGQKRRPLLITSSSFLPLISLFISNPFVVMFLISNFYPKNAFLLRNLFLSWKESSNCLWLVINIVWHPSWLCMTTFFLSGKPLVSVISEKKKTN